MNALRASFFVLTLSVFVLLFSPAITRADVPVTWSKALPTWDEGLQGKVGSTDEAWYLDKEAKSSGSLFDIGDILNKLANSFVPSSDSIMRTLAQQLARSFTHSVAEWIRTGEFDTGPLFVTNLDDMAAFALDEASGIFIDELDDSTKNLLCTPFRPQISQYMRRRNDMDAGRINFHSQYECTASDIMNNVEKMGDFKNVGWDGWQKMSQPQNNFFGVILGTEDEYNTRRMSTRRSQENQYLAGQGSLGARECLERTSTGRCARYRTNTPGSVALGAINQQLGMDTQSLIQADEANEIASALMDRVFSELGISSTLLEEIAKRGLYQATSQ